MSLADLARLARELDAASDAEAALALLAELARFVHEVDAKALKATGIGKAVNAKAKRPPIGSRSSEVRAHAKELVAKLREQLHSSARSSSSVDASTSIVEGRKCAAHVAISTASDDSGPPRKAQKVQHPQHEPDAGATSSSASSVSIVAEGPSQEKRLGIRTKFMELLQKYATPGQSTTAAEVAKEMEEALFKSLAPGPRYMVQARSVVFNLRNTSNEDFRAALLSGHILPADLPTMSSDTMASAEMRLERERIRKAAMEACESDWSLRREIPSEGQFTCGKCGGNKTWYFQFQTRSCDEPMEFFVMCRSCSHGWRHNDSVPDDIFRQVWDTTGDG